MPAGQAPQLLSMLGQFGTGATDFGLGNLFSLLNYVKDYRAAKMVQMGLENVGARDAMRQRGYGDPNSIPIVPNDEDVDRRVAMDLIPFGHDIFRAFGNQQTGIRQPTYSQPVNWSAQPNAG